MIDEALVCLSGRTPSQETITNTAQAMEPPWKAIRGSASLSEAPTARADFEGYHKQLPILAIC